MESDSHECSICMSLMVEPIRISCSHLFCLSCLEKLILDGNMKCPMDRKEFKIEKDLKFDQTIFDSNLEKSPDEFKDKAVKILKERQLMAGLAEILIVFGNKHQSMKTGEDNKHKWTAFVEVKKSTGRVTDYLNELRKRTKLDEFVGEKENTGDNNIQSKENEKKPTLDDVIFQDSDIIKKVVFKLHPTFCPNTISCKQAPFQLNRIGWGVFNVGIEIEFKDYLGLDKLEVDHFLSFSRDITYSYKPIYIDFQKVKDYLSV